MARKPKPGNGHGFHRTLAGTMPHMSYASREEAETVAKSAIPDEPGQELKALVLGRADGRFIIAVYLKDTGDLLDYL